MHKIRDIERFATSISFIITIFWILCTSGCKKHTASDSFAEIAAVKMALGHWRSTPLSCSPDGKMVVLNAGNLDQQFGLMVRRLDGQKQVESKSSDQVMLRVRWSPDSKQLCFFSPLKDNASRRCFLWNPQSGATGELPVSEVYAQPQVTWSPDGSKIAFSSTRSHSMVILYLDGHPPKTLNIYAHAFAWKEDSRGIVFIPKAERGNRRMEVKQVDIVTSQQELLFQIGEGSDLVSIDRDYSGMMVLGAYSSKSAESRVLLLDTESRIHSQLLAINGAIDGPRRTPDGKKIVWTQRLSPVRSRIGIASMSDSGVRYIEFGGDIYIQGFLPDSRSMVVSEMSPTSNRLIRVWWDGDRVSAVVADSATHTSISIESKDVEITRSDASMCIFSVASCQTTSGAGAVVIRMHPHDSIDYEGTWAQMQVLLEHHVDYINIVNDGRHGAEDVIAACHYATSVLGLPRQRILVVGGSAAAPIVMEAALKNPSVMGGVVLVGTAIDYGSRGKLEHEKIDQGIRVLAFHGELDSPNDARLFIGSVIGPEALSPPQGNWYVSPGDGHSLYHGEPFIVYSMLRALDIEMSR